MSAETSSVLCSGAWSRTCWRGLAAGLLWGLGACATLAPPESVTIRGRFPPTVDEIEITYTEGQAPAAVLKTARAMAPRQALRLPDRTLDLLAHFEEVRPFGTCAAQVARAGGRTRMRVTDSTGQPCGYLLSALPRGQLLDVLSHATLHVRGEASGPTVLGLADEAAQQRADHVPLATVSGRFDLHIALKPAARRLDLRRLASVVVVPSTQPHEVALDTFVLTGTAGMQGTTPPIGFWVWDYRRAVAHRDELFRACLKHGCRRLLVQMPTIRDPDELWTSYAVLLREARAAGIEAYALDGYPEAIRDPRPIEEKLRRLLTLLPDGGLTGVQLDIEPYVREDFFVDESGLVQYIAAIDRIKEALAGRAALSVAVPFWFTSQTVQGRPVAFAVMDRADDVAIMSYRTDMDDARAISNDALRHGALAGVPVWLALETRALPVKRQVILRREPRRELADAYLDRAGRRVVLRPPPMREGLEWFRTHHCVTIPPERLTFAGRSRAEVRAAISVIGATVGTGFAGVLVHDLDGFLALPE